MRRDAISNEEIADRLDHVADMLELEGEAWLPVMRARREGWSFTALFSNTTLAHRSGKTHDWVVIYYERGGEQRQSTVVTAERGTLAGLRVGILDQRIDAPA